MQTVSFASEGDGELIDFVAYIAKDDTGRKCHVMECPGGLANDVITTIGQAFEIRFKQHLLKKPSTTVATETLNLSFEREDDDDMRNPLVLAEAAAVNWCSPHPFPSPSPRTKFGNQSSASVFNFSEMPVKGCDSPVRHDLDDSISRVRVGSVVYTKPLKPSASASDRCETDVKDEKRPILSPANYLPYDEPWFHGKISRQECEKRLLQHGDFLVRESPASTGQFVLSGRHEGDVKHLLLVDPEGRVRTKDQLFTSVSHLINYHFQNSIPIVAIDSELLLIFPVRRPDVST